MTDTPPTLRERQAPLKARYQADPESARKTLRVVSSTTGNEPTRVRISTEEQLRLGLPEQVRIRRRFRPEAGMFLEVHRRVCQDPRLRDLAAVKLPGLKELAAANGVEPVGQANARNSWEQPLRELAQQMEQVDAEDFAFVENLVLLEQLLPGYIWIPEFDQRNPKLCRQRRKGCHIVGDDGPNGNGASYETKRRDK